MPLGRKLKSALLRLPCGHGGSKFKKDDPGLIAPRIRSPPTRTGASESVIASALLVAPQARESHSSREDTLISRGAGAGVGVVADHTARVAEGEGGEQEAKQEPTFITDNDQNPQIPCDSGYEPGPAEPVRSGTIFNDPGHIHIIDYGNPSEDVSPTLIEPEPLRTHEQTPDTVAADEENLVKRNSPLQLRNELCRNSSDDSQSSDYSNHSITQSLNPNSRPTSKVYYGQRYDSDLREARKQRFLPKSTTEPPETAGPSRPLPRPSLGVVPSFINTRNVDTGPKAESWINEPVCEYNGISASEMRGGQENGYVYSHAGAKEITLEEEQRYRNPGRETSAETTSIHQETLDRPAVIHTVIRPVENEEITTVITREIHHTEIHPIVQPIVDIERLPKKHYLETPDGKLVEITAEEAERQGWDEVWKGDLVPDERNESGFKVRDTGEAKIEEAQRRMDALELEQRNKATPPTLNISHAHEEGVYEPYGNGDIMGDNGRKAPMPLPLGFGARTGSSERVKTLRGPESYTERNVLVGPAY